MMSKTRRIVALLIAVVVTAVVSAACGSSGTSSSGSAGTTDLSVAMNAYTAVYLPFYVAQAKGYFKQANLKVSLTLTGSGGPLFAAMASAYP
jgi:NitT/TauT family transport system substrate-binding protein